LETQQREELTPSRWRLVTEIVGDAMQEPAPAARAALVAERCGGDAALQREVESLLDQTTGTFDRIAAGATDTLRRDVTSLAPGHRFGAYAIVREIGRGGMGAVYLARRADGEFEKEVAIKVLKRGTDTDEVLRRFMGERQILARLDHPGIVRLIDAGTTDDGLPYLAMDYVEGVPITEYARERQLSIPERLKLFREVCSAVAYAHQNLVVHRDLKPSNILVTKAGQPRLLDFGIAKLLQPEVDGAAATMTVLRAMTPEYASPEQVKGNAITTVSDVYSLGVVLYELLTGDRPYHLKRGSPDEITHAICEQEPERPSTTVTRNAPAAEKANEVQRQLRGDLDNIVLKALRKDPQRRYASVDQFSGDIRRHLEGLPVRARKDTISYRAGKFVGRHRLGVAAAVLLLLALLGGVIASTWEARRARSAEAKAQQRFDEVRELAHSVLFDYHDEIAALPGSTKVRERLVKDALRYLDRLAGDAGGDKRLLRELGAAYQKVGKIQGNSYYNNLGDTAGGLKSYQHSLAIRQELAAADPGNRELQNDLADSYQGVGDVLYTMADLRGGLQNYQHALPIRERLLAEEPQNLNYRSALAEIYSRLSDIKGLEGFTNLGDTAGALADSEKAATLIEAAYKADPDNDKLRGSYSDSLIHATMLADTTGDIPTALANGRTVVTLMEQAVAADPNNQDYRTALANARMTLRYALVDNNEIAEAISDSRNVITELERMAAVDPKDVALRRNISVSYNALGRELMLAGDISGAIANHGKALAISQELLATSPDNAENKSDVAFTLLRLGQAQLAAGDARAALDNLRPARAVVEASAAADPSNARARDDVSSVLGEIGKALAATGDPKGAVDTLMKAIALAEPLSSQNPTNAKLRTRLAERYFELGKIYMQLARDGGSPAGDARSQWQRARDYLGRSLACWTQLRDSGKLVPLNAGKPDEVTAEIAKCDAVLR
jgi:serine/threonine protein kinase/tetratricopeptide (TPR) repeat protein